MSTRRGFLKRALGATFTSATVIEQAFFRATRARAQAQTQYTLPTLFDIAKVTDGIYAALARPQALINCNAVIVENQSDLLIVDAHSTPIAVAALVRQLRDTVTQKPVRYVVATHFHGDHAQGLPAYRRLAPQVDIVSTEVTRKLINDEAAKRLKESFDTLAKNVDEYKRSLAQAKTPEEKAEWQQMVTETQEYVREMRTFTPELPNVTVDRDLIIHDKAHDLHLAFRGRAHTAGDIVLYCPQKKTAATGDLLHGFFPNIADGFPTDWPKTLNELSQFDFTTFAGGHGDVFRDKSRLGQMRNYIEEITEQVSRGRAAGRTLDQLRTEVTPDGLKSLADNGYGESLAQASLKYRRMAGPRPTVAALLSEGVRGNVTQVFNALGRA